MQTVCNNISMKNVVKRVETLISYKCYSAIEVLEHESAKSRVLAPTRLTSHWYVPACLRAFTLVNKRLTRFSLVLLQIPLCLSASMQKKFNRVRNDHGHTQRCEFSVLDRKQPFRANLEQKIKIVSQLKFGTQTNSNIQNSMVILTFAVLD